MNLQNPFNTLTHEVGQRITQIHFPREKKQVGLHPRNTTPGVFITGTMRSGTSLVTNILKQSGLDCYSSNTPLPFSEFNRAEDNRDGYFEIHRVHELEQRILAAFDTQWCGKYENTIPSVDTLQQDPQLSPFLHQIEAIISSMKKAKHWSIKSPSFARTLHLWHYYTKSSVCILCYRHPQSVIESIFRKDSKVSDKNTHSRLSIQYWKNHNLSLLKSTRELNIPTIMVNYDYFIAQPEKVYKAILKKLSQYGVNLHSLSDQKIHSIVKPKERHFYYQETDELTRHAEKSTWKYLESSFNQLILNDDCDKDQKDVEPFIDKFLISSKSQHKRNMPCPCESGLKYKHCCL